MRFVGIDPGLKGAIAEIDTETMEVRFWDTPLTNEMRGRKEKKRLDRKELSNILGDLDTPSGEFYPDGMCSGVVFCIEDLWGFGVQHKKASAAEGVRTGSTSMFNFARDYGSWLGVLDSLRVSWTAVSPQRWQKVTGKKGDKQESIRRAQELFPKANLIPPRCRKPSDGRAEALLIAYYAAKTAGKMQ